MQQVGVCFPFVPKFTKVIIPINVGKAQVQSGNVTSMQKITTVNVSADTIIMPQTGSVVTHQPRVAGMYHDIQSTIDSV